jgi:hypothetical protein
MRVALCCLVVALSLVGCKAAEQSQPPWMVQPPPPARPAIEGAVKSVSSADIRAILAFMHQHIVKEHGSLVPIYSVHIIDHNNASIDWWNNGVRTFTPLERVKGKWKLSTTESERIITTGINIPT